MCLFVYSYCPWCCAVLVFGLVLCNKVTVRVSAGAAEEGGGGWVEVGGKSRAG